MTTTEVQQVTERIEWDDSYNRGVVTLPGVEGRRVLVKRDEYPSEPEFYAGSPTLGYGWHGVDHVYGSGADDSIVRALDELYNRERRADRRDWRYVFARYLRIFHGTTEVEWFGSTVYQGGPWYVTFDTAAWRAEHEITEGSSVVSSVEWQAYIDNEVFILTEQVAVQRKHVAATFEADEFDADPVDHLLFAFNDAEIVTEWDNVDGPVHGYYGESDAAHMAAEMLREAVA